MPTRASSSSLATNTSEPPSVTTESDAIVALDSALLALRPQVSAHHHISFLANKLRHHIQSPSRPNEPSTTTVWLFDSTAYHAPPHASSPWRLQPWETQIKAAYFGSEGNGGRPVGGGSNEVLGMSGESCQEEGEEARRRRQTREQAIRAVVDAAGLEWTEVDAGLVESRLEPWSMKTIAGKTAEVKMEVKRDDGRIPDSAIRAQSMRLEPGNASGTSTTTLRVPEDEYRDGEELEVYAAAGCEGSISARARICSGKGSGVISTLEGTLWQFDISDVQSIIRKVFCEVPEPVGGMPNLLAHVAKEFVNPPVWYLTTAPYCLYPMLRQFRDEHYLSGTIVLRETDWTTASSLLSSFTEKTKQYKLEQLQQIYKQFPRRSMVLIGSATESDAQAFVQVYQQHPEWIKAIFIRRAAEDSRSQKLDEGQNEQQMLERIFEPLPKDIWTAFTAPSELYERVHLLAKRPAKTSHHSHDHRSSSRSTRSSDHRSS